MAKQKATVNTYAPEAEQPVLKPVLALPKQHEGNIPAAVIRASVRKVVAERRRREAEAAASGTAHQAPAGGTLVADLSLARFEHERHLLGPATRLPGKHKGNIPAAVIRASVRKVVLARKRREAAAIKNGMTARG